MKYYLYIALLFIEYLQFVIQKDILKTIEDPIYIVFNGLKMLLNSIKYIWSKTLNIDKVYKIGTNAYVIYLEYVEQMYKTNITYNLNNNIVNDGIIFVFKKIDEQLDVDKNELINVANQNINIEKYLDMTQYLLGFQNNYVTTNNNTEEPNKMQNETVYNMLKLSENYLLKYFKLIEYLDNQKVKSIIHYLVIIQEKCEMKYSTFFKFQELIMKKIKKWCEKEISQKKIMNKLFDIFYNEEIKMELLNYINNLQLNDVIKIISLY
jgi:hypothetical protein